MRISEKGQVTIPKNLRDLAGIKPDSEVRIMLEGNRVVIESVDPKGERAKTARIARFLEDLQKIENTGNPDLRAGDVMAVTRDRD